MNVPIIIQTEINMKICPTVSFFQAKKKRLKYATIDKIIILDFFITSLL